MENPFKSFVGDPDYDKPQLLANRTITRLHLGNNDPVTPSRVMEWLKQEQLKATKAGWLKVHVKILVDHWETGAEVDYLELRGDRWETKNEVEVRVDSLVNSWKREKDELNRDIAFWTSSIGQARLAEINKRDAKNSKLFPSHVEPLRKADQKMNVDPYEGTHEM